MTTVCFRFDYREGEHKYRAGEVVQVPDLEAQRLAASGVADIRRDPGPTETKEAP